METKLELVPLPVSDVDRARAFYTKIGFDEEIDQRVGLIPVAVSKPEL